MKAKVKILIVEDEKLVAADIQNFLEHLGYQVTAAVSTGRAAIKETARTKPDLILMDIILKGGMDGIETAEHIRNQFGIPIVFVVANADPQTVERAKKIEPYGYILKPYHEDELQAVIEMALYKHRMERRLRESEERFRSLYENATIGIYRTTPAGKILMANPALVAMTGFSSFEELAKRNLEEQGFKHNYPRDAFKKHMEQK